MAPRCLVLNEWVLHDLRGDNGVASHETAIRLLVALIERRDQIVVLRGSRWWHKAYDLMTRTEPAVRIASKLLWLGVLQNATACKLLEPNDVLEAPEELAKVTPPDDLYLVRTYLAGGAALLVTSDTRLFQALKESVRVSVVMKAEFLREYVG